MTPIRKASPAIVSGPYLVSTCLKHFAYSGGIVKYSSIW